VNVDPRAPVLVGAGAISEKRADPLEARDAVGLMVGASELAASDCGRPDILERAGLVLVPQGTWRFKDAGRRVAGHFSANGARTVFARLGVLQTTLFERAANAIALGDTDVAVVVGAEAKWRDALAMRTGVQLPNPEDAGAEPDETLVPEREIISADEIKAGLVAPVSQYALLENARRYSDGQSPEDHARTVADLWAGFSAVASNNPFAWDRRLRTEEEIRVPGKNNRPLALPYNKLHVSQWNVDQSAALILCSTSTARSIGIAEDRWVFLQGIAESNYMVPVSERSILHRSPGFEIAGREVFGRARVSPDDIAHVDLYSCFPIAVRTQATELGLTGERQLTVTGGMTFGGGPLNNYTLQSTARMAQVLREDPGSLGLVTAVSGMLTKQGVALWGSRPSPSGYGSADVSQLVEEGSSEVEICGEVEGHATVATYTVLYGEGGVEQPDRAVVLADLANGRRAIVTSADREVAKELTAGEWCGRKVRVRPDNTFDPE